MKKINWEKRVRSKPFLVAAFSFIALTGQVFGLYEVPQEWDNWVNLLLSIGVAAGIIVDPTTSGMSDK